MPDATPFYGSAMGNGFSFCLKSVNVADAGGTGTPYDYWTTLGGTNKDNVAGLSAEQKAANISLSWQNAWRLYWMIYALHFTNKFTWGDDSGSINSVDDNSNLLASPAGVTPLDRLCKNDFESSTFNASEGYGVAFGYPPSDFYVGFRSTSDAVPIVRMYNGATTDEANFVGYGIKSNFTEFYNAGAFPEPPDAGLIAPVYDSFAGLSGYIICQSYLDKISPTPSDSDYAYTKVPISGSMVTVDMVCGIYYFGADTSSTLDAFNRSAIIDTNETSIDSIEFYAQ